MALELRQHLKLTQQLVMTPQLQQAIKLLQLSRLELIETVQQELLENPFLEEAENELSVELDNSDDLRPQEDERDVVYENELATNADWEDYLGEFASSSRQAQLKEVDISEEGTSFEARFAAKPSLESHLHWQLRLSHLTERQKQIGEYVIGSLDSSGYLSAGIEELCEIAEASEAEVGEVLCAVQRFDPVGVAASSPQECLLVQIEVNGYDRDPVLVELIRDHLEDLEQRRYKPLLKKFSLDIDDLQEYLHLITSLDPLPGASFGGDDPLYVSPDVYVYSYEDDFVIVLNDEGLPHLQLNDMYEGNLGRVSDKDRDYIQEKIRAASWLIKSLHQRQRTLYKVVESVVRHQKDFFREGVAKLHPLILKDIADDIEMHESTVSRITTNKFVATPHGIFELKFFFNSALELDDGTQVGSESVKMRIKNLIAGEDSHNPLSDERIGEILKEQLKINIARRTIAKYRTAMGIESSSRRKKIF